MGRLAAASMMAVDPETRERECVRVLGIPVNRITMAETLHVLERFVASGEPHLVVTADASGIAQAQTDEELRRIYLSADLVTPDSQGVLWAARRSGTPLSERVSGVDIVDRVCGLSAEKGYKIYFLGAAPGVAEEAAAKMRVRHPSCNIVGAHHGYFPPTEDQNIAKAVAETQPDFLFVAMGIPRQEKFIRETSSIIKAKVGMGVGGTFDVFSGRVRRAPPLFRRMKIEWLWRLLQNPKKIGKVMMLPRFVAYVLKEKR